MKKEVNLIAVAVAMLAIAGIAFYGGQTSMKKSQSSRSGAGARAFDAGDGQARGGFRQGGGGAPGGNRAFGGGGFTAGEVLSSDGTTMTVKMPDGSTKLVLLTASTTVSKQAEGTADDLTEGTNVMVTGQTNDDGSVTAENVQIRPDGAPMFGGGGMRGMEQTEASPTPEGAGEPDVTVELTGKNYEFSEGEIRVHVGDTVKVKLTSESGFHDWVIDEFGAHTARVMTDGSSETTFIADKAGTYEYYCSVGNHRENGMKGTLIVE